MAAGSHGGSLFGFLRNLQQISIVDGLTHIPTVAAEGLTSVHLLASIVACSPKGSMLARVTRNLSIILPRVPLVTSETEHSRVLLAVCGLCFEGLVSFAPLLIT